MKFTLSWLKKFLLTDSSLAEITTALTAIGLEIEEVIDRQTELKPFEVAEIITAIPHPAADKLKICEVKTKEGVLQIVCGAANARSSIKVVLAKIGTEIPSGKFKIKESEIRGVKSFGMLCSEQELLIGSDASGIIELPSHAIIGEQILKYYGLDDPVIHINVTPNRGDALSVYGIARDLAATGLGKLQELEISSIKTEFNSDFTLRVQDHEICPLFAMREIRGLANKQPPEWLKKLLKNIGVGSISPVVDVTNYICYSFGQPMHAYDADNITTGLTIEQLKLVADFKALNDKEYKLQANDLIIRDDKEIQCLAGIIGGKTSSCNETTTRILLEAACFDATTITKAGRQHQIITDSRYRFERNIDRAFTIKALEIATDMILSICGGQPSPIITQDSNEHDKQVIEIPIRELINNIQAIPTLNLDICNTILTALGFVTTITNEVIKITIPSWRHDIAIKEDIIEEIYRIYGYDKIVETTLPLIATTKTIHKEYKRTLDTRRILASQGYDEVVTWSFMDSNIVKNFTIPQEELLIINPISNELNYMRPTIIPNLLGTVAKNIARSAKNLALFEVGPVFKGTKPEEEIICAAGVRCGYEVAKNFHSPLHLTNVFDIKADLQTILSYLGLAIDKCQITPINLPYYHPTKSASLNLGKNLLATFGQIHPKILTIFDIDCEVMAFELNFAAIPFGKAKFAKRDEFTPSDFQTTTRDYAVIVDKNQPVGDLLNFIKNVDKKLIKSVELFDIYSGEKVQEGFKSVALSVQIQADDKTLTEEDLNQLSNAIILGLEQKFMAKLRE